MIAYGILIPSYGSHFTKYSLSETQAGYFYAICAFSYLVSSLLVSFLPSEWNKPRLMFFGTLVMAFGFLMIGPCTIIFPDTLLIAIIGLVVIGVGGGFMFVFCVPHMIEVAIEDYQFPKDDYLHDSLSKLNNVSMCIGDIIGPTFSTVMCSFIGFSNTANIFFIILIIFGLTYGVLSDAFWFKIVPSEDREVLNIKES
jgi:MFS family permease